MATKIHPTAVIEPTVVLGEDVVIEPYAVIRGQVTIADQVCIKSHVYIEGHVEIGRATTIWPGAVIGTQTQALKYQGEVTHVKIGPRCQIRECVTINSSYGEGETVSVGEGSLIMAYCHIAHHCHIGQGVIMSNAVNLAGHVTIGSHATIGGMSAFHQRTRVGEYAMVGGMSRVTHDVPPFTMGGGIPYKMGGINRVGLKRANFLLEQRKILSQLFQITYREKNAYRERMEKIKQIAQKEPLALRWLEFCQSSMRGLIDLPSALQKEPSSQEEASTNQVAMEPSSLVKVLEATRGES